MPQARRSPMRWRLPGRAGGPHHCHTARVADRTHCRARSEGYTLLELIVVILLLSILLGFAIPAFQTGGLAGSKDSTARELMHAVNKLKMDALSRRRINKLHLNLDENRIWVTRDADISDTGELPNESAHVLPGDIRIASVRFAGRPEIRTGVTAIAFYPQGYSDRAVIRLTDGGPEPVDLVIEAFLPTARITDPGDAAVF